jgi:hypothetical protein
MPTELSLPATIGMGKEKSEHIQKLYRFFETSTQTLVVKILSGGHPYHRSSHDAVLTSIYFRLLLYLAAGFEIFFIL